MLRLLRLGWVVGVLAGLWVAAPAHATIIYGHAGGIWAMGDDGSGPHVLVSNAEVPGVPDGSIVSGPITLPTGNTAAFTDETNEYCVSYFNQPCGGDYEGIYTLSDGVLTRDTPPPVPASNLETGESTPKLTADGRMIFGSFEIGFQGENNPIYSAGSTEVRPVGQGQTATAWSFQPNGGIAYPSGPAAVDQIATANAGANDDGFSPGIWMFPATANATPHELLADPNPIATYGYGTFTGITFAGPSELVFSATGNGAKNLWEIPTSCTASTCSFPASAKQLTSDGDDTAPTWTCQVVAPAGDTTGGGGSTAACPGGTSGGGGGPGGTGGTGTTSGTVKVGRVKVAGTTASVPVRCSGAKGAACKVAAALIAIETLKGNKVIAVSAAKKHKSVVLGFATVSLSASQSKTVKLTLTGTGKRLLRAEHTLKVELTIVETIGKKSSVVSTHALTFKSKKPPTNKH